MRTWSATLPRNTPLGWKCSTSGHKAEEARGRGSLRALEDAERAGKDTFDNSTRITAPVFPSTTKRSMRQS